MLPVFREVAGPAERAAQDVGARTSGAVGAQAVLQNQRHTHSGQARPLGHAESLPQKEGHTWGSPNHSTQGWAPHVRA